MPQKRPDLLKPFQASAQPAEVPVDGWVHRTGDARIDFLKNRSDHGPLCAQGKQAQNETFLALLRRRLSFSTPTTPLR